MRYVFFVQVPQGGDDDDDYEMDDELKAWLQKHKLLSKVKGVFAKHGIENMDALDVPITDGLMTMESLLRDGVKTVFAHKLLKAFARSE